jgi:hypothetical protein
MFRFSDEQELSALLQSAGLAQVAVQGYAFVHRLGSADELWNGILHGTVRTSIGIRRQSKDVRARIRVAFDRLVQPYTKEEGAIQIPVAFKIVAGRRLLA